MTPLETLLYNALLLLRRGNGTLDMVFYGVYTFKLTELDVAQVEAALGAYEDAATIARLREGLPPVVHEGLPPADDERARLLAERLAGHK